MMHTAPNAENWGSTPTPLPMNPTDLSTITSPGPAHLPTGIEPFGRGLATLRNLAETTKHKPNAAAINQQIQASLRQDFGSRLVIKERLNDHYELVSFTATISGQVGEGWIKALEYYTRPSPGDQVAMEVTRMRSLTAKRKEGEFDLELSIGAITEELCEYPQDIVFYVCRTWARTNTFFPTLKELIDACEKLNKPRQELLRAARDSNLIEFKKSEKEPEWTPPTEADKAKVAELVAQAVKDLGVP